jgi:hypothetical protein
LNEPVTNNTIDKPKSTDIYKGIPPVTSTTNSGNVSSREPPSIGEEGTSCNYFPLPGSKDTTVGNIKHTMLGSGYLGDSSSLNGDHFYYPVNGEALKG